MDVFENEIKEKLTSLTYEKKMLFALLTCEKLYPNYLYFQKRCNWGNSNALLEAMAAMYQSLFKSNLFSHPEILNYIEAVDLATPDTEDFSDSWVSSALDACTAVYSSLNFMIDRDIKHVIDVATYARDTVYMFIVNRDNLDMNVKGMDDKVSNDPLMLREMNRQSSTMDKLGGLKDSDISDELIRNLNQGLPIIDIDNSN
ncbi:DUF416 family protein [Pedobacter sp. KR3-3]|uniref:DUF416 family protein n=1 Tax=Pedobacter albus TaxID=3113905 RepID=A0ABU7ICZ1_9SPHI|nr:DUF416 family protein [Pedobacter sp. KR3-3]MEE1947242.1 DUF416 family protein [Pedobacter sp. KR3-3]